jgi:hypothetical protein
VGVVFTVSLTLIAGWTLGPALEGTLGAPPQGATDDCNTSPVQFRDTLGNML